MEAAKAASARPLWNTSMKSRADPAPPDAITGMETALATNCVNSQSKPALVPSRSIEVSMISPAPQAVASRAHKIASRPVGMRPPATNTSKPRFLRLASMATTTAWEPKRAAIFPISAESFTAAELIAILSAPASNTASASASSRIPPPTVNGINKQRAVRETTSIIMRRLSLVAVISSRTISSAPSRA